MDRWCCPGPKICFFVRTGLSIELTLRVWALKALRAWTRIANSIQVAHLIASLGLSMRAGGSMGACLKGHPCALFKLLLQLKHEGRRQLVCLCP